MGFKSASIVLLGLALCCFLQGTIAAQGDCVLEFVPDKTKPATYGWTEGEGTRYAPFTTWYISSKGENKTRSAYNSFDTVKNQEACDECVLTTYESNDLTGKSYAYDFRTGTYSYEFPAAIKSFNVKCFREGDPVFQEMNENDGSTLPHSLVDLRHKGFQQAVDRLVSKGSLSAGTYTAERVFSTEFAKNYEGIYKFHVRARDESGAEHRVWFTTYAYTEDYQTWNAIVLEVGYKENRIGEFTPQFKPFELEQEGQGSPYPEVETMGVKAIDRAVAKLQAKGTIPQGTYKIFYPFSTFDSVEFSAITNMTEYPDHNDALYRIQARIVDQSGVIFRVWVIIATNYETPEYYELIDFDYKMTSLAEFDFADWMPMDSEEGGEEEEEGGPIPDYVKALRTRSVAQSVPRLQAEGALPEGKYTIAKTYETEIAHFFSNPNIPYYMYDVLYKFNVQLANEAGARFRVTVALLHNDNWEENKYELIDYLYIENRLDEFTNTNFRSLNEGDLQTESINQAVEKLTAKNTLPAGQYTISKTFPTEFSANFEHPDYSTDDYILYKFTAQVKNAAGAEYKIYSIVITAYDAPENFELIDYGKLDA